MIVRRIAAHSERVKSIDSAENQRDLGLRHMRHPRHEADVAHRTIATDGDVEQGSTDSASENAALDRTPARMRYVEDQLVDQRLGGKPRSREDELLVRILLTVDAGIDRGSTVIEAE